MCYKSTEVENTVAEESERDYKEVARGDFCGGQSSVYRFWWWLHNLFM